MVDDDCTGSSPLYSSAFGAMLLIPRKASIRASRSASDSIATSFPDSLAATAPCEAFIFAAANRGSTPANTCSLKVWYIEEPTFCNALAHLLQVWLLALFLF